MKQNILFSISIVIVFLIKYLKFETVGVAVRKQRVQSFILTIANITVKVRGYPKPPEFAIFKAEKSFFESLQIV